MKKLICFILVLMFSTQTIFADSLPTMVIVPDEVVGEVDGLEELENVVFDDSIETYFLPMAIPTGQAIVYIMGALGVVGTSSAIFANADTIQAWGEEQIENFKVKALALGLTAELVGNWLDKLGTGVLDKSSEVWNAFKTWVGSLRDSVKVPVQTDFDFESALLPKGSTLDILSLLPSLKSKYDTYYILAKNGDCYIVPKYSSSGYLYSFIVISTCSWEAAHFYFKRIDGASDLSRPDGTLYTYNGNKYYYSSSPTFMYENPLIYSVPGMYRPKNGLLTTEVINAFLSGTLSRDEVVLDNDYSIVGGITDINGVNVSNPWDTTANDVVINWDNVNSLGGVAGVIGGVADGSMTWDDMLTAGNVVVGENDTVIGGDETINPPVEEVPETDWTWWDWLKDWILSFFDTLGNLLKSLFIPSAEFFPSNFNRLKDSFSVKFGFDNYVELLEGLKNVGSGQMDFGGFIDTSMWLPYLDKIHYYIKGFFYAIIIIFNIRMLMWTVRGSSPIAIGESSGKNVSSKGGKKS